MALYAWEVKYLPAIAALLAAIGLRLAARRGAPRWLAPLAAPAGLAFGWVLALGLTLPPRGVAGRLAWLGLLLPAIPPLMRLTPRRVPSVVPIALCALLGGWLLAGAPPQASVANVGWIALAAGAMLANAWILAAAEGWAGAATLAFWVALHAIGAPPPWPAAALVVGLAWLGGGRVTPPQAAAGKRGKRAKPTAAGVPAMLPLALALGALEAAAMPHAGWPLRRHGAVMALAALAPFLAFWLARRLRWRRLGRLAPAFGAMLGLLLTALLAFSAAAIGGLR